MVEESLGFAGTGQQARRATGSLPDDPIPPMISQAFVILRRTESAPLRICGLSVLERTVRSLLRGGFQEVLVFAEDPASRRPELGEAANADEVSLRPLAESERAMEAMEGPALVITEPLAVDTEAVKSLKRLRARTGPLTLLSPRDRSPTGALLLPARWRGDSSSVVDGTAARGLPAAPVPAGVFQRVQGVASAKAAEKALVAGLRKSNDGFMAFWFDRRISGLISRQLVKTGITPNAISLLTLVPALAGAALIAMPGTLLPGIGTLLFLLSTVFDGCDGEVARLKFLESERGAKIDLTCDNVALVALFTAIVVHVYGDVKGPAILWAGIAIVTGILIAALSEYLLILSPRIRSGKGRKSAERHSKRQEMYERLASRDFAYLLPVLAFAGGLEWFVWATAIGVNVFWIVLVTVVARKAGSTAS